MAINNNYPIVSIVMVTILMAIALPGGVEAQSPASAPMPEIGPSAPMPEMGPSAPMPEMDPCLSPLLNMSDCLSYVSTGSNETKPSKDCCPELAGLVESNPICLCNLLGGPDKLGLDLSIDVKRALQLPSLCKVETPPVSTCAALGIPVAAPIESLTPTLPPSLPSASGDISPGAAAAGPATTNNENGGSSLAITSLQCFVGLTFMIFSTFF